MPFVPESSAVGDAKVCGDVMRKHIMIMEAENPCSKAWESRTKKASHACRGAFSFFLLFIKKLAYSAKLTAHIFKEAIIVNEPRERA